MTSNLREKLRVFLTVDTELWPLTPHWRESGLEQEMDYYIYGTTREGNFGLPFQMDVLNAHRLKAVFFVESLFACVVGLDPLRKIVGMIQERGHEVQLHMHTEWLAQMRASILPGRTGQNLRDFCVDEQTQLIARGIDNLRACDVRQLYAFRAGNYGANFDTLRALARNGILYDTSYNACYLHTSCDMQTPELLLQPQRLHGVHEFPIAFFRDYPGHYRHAQLCACSIQELENALLRAWKHGWYAFVLVSHSFELLQRRSRLGKSVRRDRMVSTRFERLCRFLADHRDKFCTTGFADLFPSTIPPPCRSQPLCSSMYQTIKRVGEQLIAKVL